MPKYTCIPILSFVPLWGSVVQAHQPTNIFMPSFFKLISKWCLCFVSSTELSQVKPFSHVDTFPLPLNSLLIFVSFSHFSAICVSYNSQMGKVTLTPINSKASCVSCKCSIILTYLFFLASFSSSNASRSSIA